MHEYQTDQIRAGEPTRVPAAAKTSVPSPSPGGLLLLQRRYGNRFVQRLLGLSRKGEGEAEVDPGLELAITQARGGGRALDSGVRLHMEHAFGSDFSGVRVHTGAQSDALNKSLSAVAFTTGQDIFFRDSAYDPGSREGKELLAHELTHVVQQGGPAVKGKLTVGAADDLYEREADSVARQVVAGLEGTTAPPVQRQCACGGHSGSGGGECVECKQQREASVEKRAPSHAETTLRPKAQNEQSAPTAVEFVPERPFSDGQPSAPRSKAEGPSLEVVKITEAVVTRHGVRRRISLRNRSDAWIARRMNWKDTACKAACWAIGGALAVIIAAQCAVGSVFTFGAYAIACTTVLGIIGAAAGGAGASLCSDICDNAYATNASASAASADDAGADTAVANADDAQPDGADQAFA